MASARIGVHDGSPAVAPAAGTIVVFSHLRWDFVYQRPQQLLTRLAAGWRVIYVEEPLHDDGLDTPRLDCTVHDNGLTVLVPRTAVAAGGFHDDQLAALEPMLARWLEAEDALGAIAWLHTPMALPLVKLVAPALVVYDCMDELSAFRGAPRQLRQRERALMQRADLVLAGGPSLYAARYGRHANLHCVPSAVDAEHFAPARLRRDSEQALQAAALQADFDGPRLGYFGVIDERFDAALIERLADAHPHWQLVMVGPVRKIDAQTLPRRANIHWLGMQPYERLPHLLNGWDIALLPFVLDASTRFISPTKTLEYLAGETPVVSTAIQDVVALYGEAVAIGRDHAGFLRCCEELLAEPAARRARRQVEMMSLVWTSSWQRTADSLHGLLLRALEQARLPQAAAAASPVPAVAAG